MSHLHFVANERYRQRVIQLGEQPDRVFLVGSPSIDSINRLTLLNRAELEDSINFKFGLKNLLITFHPVTLERITAEKQLEELLRALVDLKDTHLIFTMPNADTDGRELIKLIQNFVDQHSNARAYTSLGQLHYLSCVAQVDGVVGNSSSGLVEVPSFKKGTINIGDRQRGRLQAKSVINCEPERTSITAALKVLYSSRFQDILGQVINPYGNSGASELIVSVIKKYPLDGILKKHFFDISEICE
jgi:GDP/UDP-N,N'-diacetylbacillosamine 2-epimerase (hydrolysing)